MIKNHPKYPAKVTEQYFLMSKLPGYQVYPNREVQVKDHHYYNDNYNIWNNPYQANKKNFNSFHVQNIAGKDLVNQRLQIELGEKITKEKQRIDILSQEREKQLSRLKERKLERTLLQVESNQIEMQMEAEVGDKGFLYRTLNNKSNTAANGRADFLWNKMNKLSDKQIQQAINQKIVSMDEKAVAFIQQKIDKDNEVEQIKNELGLENVKKIRQQFKEQHYRNHEFERKVGLVPQNKPDIQFCHVQKPKILLRAQSSQNSQHPLNKSIDIDKQKRLKRTMEDIPQDNDLEAPQNLGTKYNLSVYLSGKNAVQMQSQRIQQEQYPQKYVNISTYEAQQKRVSNDVIDRLAQPKKGFLMNGNALDRTEFKGLLVSEVDDVTKNLRSSFNKTMIEASIVLRETLQNSRPATKGRTTLRNSSQISHYNNDQRKQSNDMQELDEFDRLNKNKQKRIGFPKASLDSMQNQVARLKDVDIN